ncbi:hypothetical protein ACET7G_10060 [Aeromonas hydrophila]|uniref:hypothetical protein n=1 Tax=Aeromonas hydrophila TaxID=644 RepID=UPI0038CFAE14
MRTEFYLDKETLSDICFLSDENPAAHDLLLKTWYELGIFIMPIGRPEHAKEIVNSVPEKYRKKWQEALTGFPISRLNKEMSYLSQYQSEISLNPLYGEIKSLLVSANTEYSFIDKTVEHKLLNNNQNEAIRASHIANSLFFKKSEQLKDKQISKDELPDEIWESRFHALSKHEKNIFIVDRYLGDRVLKSTKSGKLRNNSLYFLLKKLRDYPSSFNISIFTDGKEINSPIHNALNSFIENQKHLFERFTSFEIMSIRSICFDELTHDRYIRIGSNLCEVGIGMEIFELDSKRRTSFSMKVANKTDVYSLEEEIKNKDVRWTLTASS